MAALELQVYFGFSDGSHLRRPKFICISNFVDISQSTTEILLFPISENKLSQYWNSTSGFYSVSQKKHPRHF